MIFNCETCGKQVERSYMDEYIYKKSFFDKEKGWITIYFCGWNCMRKYEKERTQMQYEKRIGTSHIQGS